MRRIFLLSVGFALWADAALASRCGPFIDLLDDNSPSVVISGTVEAVRAGGPSAGYVGAASVFIDPSHPNAGSNTATILVTEVLKGEVAGDRVDVSADRQDGINLGFAFRPGPISLVAWRRSDGSLVTNFCGILDYFDNPQLPLLRQAMPRIAAAKGAVEARPDDYEARRALSALYRQTGDRERDAALWANEKEAQDAGRLREYGIARSRLGKHAEAAEAFERASALGPDDETMRLLGREYALLGQVRNPSEIDLAGLALKRLDLTGLNLPGKYLTGLRVSDLVATGVNLSGARAREVQTSKFFAADGKFDGADFGLARLLGLSAPRASFRSVNFAGGMLEVTDVAHADFTGANLAGVRIFGPLRNARFDKAVLIGAALDQMAGASFRGADLSHARIYGALHGADLTGARLDGVSWRQVTYDCATTFPKGFDPAAAGLLIFEGPCRGKPKSVLPKLPAAERCGIECHRWLAADPTRKVLIIQPDSFSPLREGLLYSAGGWADGACPAEAARFGQQMLVQDRQTSLPDGFCPRIVPNRAEGRR